MPAMLRTHADARTITQPEPATFRLLLRHFQTLPPPDTLDHRQADLPARMAEQRMDAPIAVPAIILRQRDDVGRQALLIGIVPWWMTLRRTMLTQNTAGPSLRYRQRTTDLLDCLAATGGT